jgi:hypothetical protein
MIYAMDGGVWLHRHRIRDEPMIHLVSARRAPLLLVGDRLGLDPVWLQYKPLKDPRTDVRVDAWHWDLWGERMRRLEEQLAPGQ